MTTEQRLLLSMHRGCDDSARRLWEAHAPSLLAYARAIAQRGPVSADDVVQQAFCRVLERPRREVRQVRDVRAWLCTIVRSTALNAARSQRREMQRRCRHAPPTPADDAPDPSEILSALDRLTPPQREAILLRHAARLTFDQMALATGENRNTIASRYATAIERLRSLMRHTTPEPRAHQTEPMS